MTGNVALQPSVLGDMPVGEDLILYAQPQVVTSDEVESLSYSGVSKNRDICSCVVLITQLWVDILTIFFKMFLFL